MWLIIIFILGTLCVIFNEKIGEFFSKIIDLDLIFLSKKEKKIKQQQQAFLKESPEKLYPVYDLFCRNMLTHRGNDAGMSKWKNVYQFCLIIIHTKLFLVF